MTRRKVTRFRQIGLILICLLLVCLCRAQESSPAAASSNSSTPAQGKAANYANLSLEELMEIKVTSASRQRENLAQAPAAIFVITAEDIRRGGFSSIAEALRMAPGLYVATINRHWWTVSARGFSDYVNNKNAGAD